MAEYEAEQSKVAAYGIIRPFKEGEKGIGVHSLAENATSVNIQFP